LPEASLECSDPWFRALERDFRRTLAKWEIGDDTPIDAFFPVSAAFKVDPPNTWGLDIAFHHPDTEGGAWAYDPPIKTEADLDKLRLPTYIYDRTETERRLSQASELFEDILPVKLVCEPPLDPNLAFWAAELRGLGEMMMDMAIRPEITHRLMAHVRDTVLHSMRQVEDTGLLTPNNVGPLFLSDPIGPEPVNGAYTFKNLWGAANAQEFDQVSPAMFEEFYLSYQMPIFELYGLVCYGCCEDLTHKMDAVLKIPNLRIFVCSAWTDLDKAIERAGSHCCIMWRQKASDVVFPDDTASVRRHLNEGMRRLQGCRYQVVLRELQTLAGHPDRLHEWTRIAIEAAERFA